MNLSRLNEKIKENRYHWNTFSDAIGIKYQAFRRRMKGEVPFYLDEAFRICDILNIQVDSAEFKSIFYDQ